MLKYRKILNWRFWAIFIFGIFSLFYYRFQNVFGFYQYAVFFQLLLPLSIIIFIFREKLSDYGFTFGNKKLALLYTIMGVLITLIVTFVSAKYFPSIRYYYNHIDFNIRFFALTFIYMISWEFIYRGFLLFGMSKYIGPTWSNIIQTILFYLTHIGKPQIEAISTLFTGLLFGYISLKSKSVYPMIIIHTTIMTSIVFFISIT